MYQFLFDNTQTNYAGEQGSALFRPSGRDSAPPANATSSSFLAGLRDSTGRSTAPITAGYGGGGLSEALLNNSGMTGTTAGMYRSGSVGTQFSGLDFDDNRRIDEQMVRSRSAAPSMLGRSSLMPPPGLGMSSHNGEAPSSLFGNAPTRNNIMEMGQRRAASTGLLGEYDPDSYSVLSSLGREFDHGGSGAVRPAPKTLMDLIQEDIPNDHVISRPQTAAPYLEREAVSYLERENTSYGYQNNTHRSRSASPPHQSQIMDVVPQAYQVQRRDMDPYQQHDDNMGGLSHQMEHMHVGRGHHQHPYDQAQQRQYQVGNGSRGFLHVFLFVSLTLSVSLQHREQSRGPQYMTVPSSQAQRGDQQTRLQGRDSQMHEQPQQRSIYAPVRVHGAPQNHHHHQLSHQSYDAQPQVYYSSGQHGGPTPQMTQQPQVQILPSGQAVYVQAPPQYNYANVQYLPQQHHLQQSPLGQHQHQQITSDPHQQYISVMPVQGGGGQVTYWQHPEMQVGGMAPSPVIMAPRGGHQQVPMGRSSAPAIDRSPQHGGRAKGNAGTRSPSNTGGKVRGGRGAGRGRNDPHAKNNASGTPVASALLEDFRAIKNRDWTILDIEGHVVEFCQDQNGSRFIQQRLEIGNPNEQQVVMAEVLPAVRQLRNDVFGNYVVQKLLEFGTPEMKIGLRDTLQGEMLPLSMQMYG
jgi:Pumilio-family RNA binding repeat